jgi:hypothetical protein
MSGLHGFVLSEEQKQEWCRYVNKREKTEKKRKEKSNGTKFGDMVG